MQNDSNPGRHRFRRFRAAVAAFSLAASLALPAATPAVAGVAESHARLDKAQEWLAQARERTTVGGERIAQRQERISLSEAIRLVEQRSGGKVLRAETRREKDRTVHRIRVITDDGRVRTWEVDAESGRIG